MKSILSIYNAQVSKVFRLMKQLKSTKNPLTRDRLTNQLSQAQAYARELDGARNDSYQMAALLLTSYNENDLINPEGHKFYIHKKPAA